MRHGLEHQHYGLSLWEFGYRGNEIARGNKTDAELFQEHKEFKLDFNELQNLIKDKYPDFKDLPLLTRIKIRLNDYPMTMVECIDEGTTKISQTYKVYGYQGKKYFYKFGW